MPRTTIDTALRACYPTRAVVIAGDLLGRTYDYARVVGDHVIVVTDPVTVACKSIAGSLVHLIEPSPERGAIAS